MAIRSATALRVLRANRVRIPAASCVAIRSMSSAAALPASSAPAASPQYADPLDKFDIGKHASAELNDDEVEVDDEELFEDPRLQILDAALEHVHCEGWSMEALAAGANHLGYPAVSSGMFDKGAVELVWHVMRKANLHMSETLEHSDLASLRVNQRVKVGVQARLGYFARYQRNWAQAMALGLQPTALPETLNLLAIAADEVWYWAGDRSTDLNWYTRRLLLMGVMAATETAMLTDRSAGLAETWEFLDRRLQDVTHFGRTVSDNLSVLAAAAGGIGSIANAGFDMLRPLVVRDSASGAGAGASAPEFQYGNNPAGATAPSSGAAAPDSSSAPSGQATGPAVGSGAAAASSHGSGPATGPYSTRPSKAGSVILPGLGNLGAGGTNPLQSAAQAAAAAASVAQAVATQAASLTGVKLPDPQAVLGALGSLSNVLPKPPIGGGSRPVSNGVSGYARPKSPVEV